MTDRAGLLDAISHRPGADLPRLVFADYLDDHGEPARASFIRHQVAAARLPPGSPERFAHLSAADELEAGRDAEWLGDWRGRLADWEFRRGFVHRVRITLGNWLAHGERLFDWEPVGELTIVDDADGGLEAREVAAAVAHPAFRMVRAYTAAYAQGANPWPAALAGAGHVGQLRSLTAMENGITRAEDFAALCAAQHLRSLRALRLNTILGGREGGGDPRRDLAGASFARRLRHLLLTEFDFDWPELVAGGPLASLRSLSIRGWFDRDAESRRRMYHSPRLAKLRTIELRGLDPAFAESPLARRVTGLCVDHISEPHDDVCDAAGWADFLRRVRPPHSLEFNYSRATADVLGMMAETGWLRECRELTVGGGGLNPNSAAHQAGVRRLFRPGSLPKLARAHFASPYADALLGDWDDRVRLESLVFDDGMSVAALAGSPRLAVGRVPGLRVVADAELARLVGLLGPAATHLDLTLFGPNGSASAPTPGGVSAFLTGANLPRLRSLVIDQSNATLANDSAARRLADPGVLPELLTLAITHRVGAEPLAGLRRRFGARLRLV